MKACLLSISLVALCLTASACLDKAPFRRALDKLEQGTTEERVLAQKVRAGDELTDAEKELFENAQVAELQKMLDEIIANLSIWERGNTGNMRFPGACTDSLLALSDMTELRIDANLALKKAEASYPPAVRYFPVVRTHEDPAITWIAEDSENYAAPSYKIFYNGEEVPASFWKNIHEQGGFNWFRNSKSDQVSKVVNRLFGSEEATRYLRGRVADFPLEGIKNMQVGEYGGLSYRGRVVNKTTSGGFREYSKNSSVHIVFIYKISDEQYAMLDVSSDGLSVFDNDELLEFSIENTLWVNDISRRKILLRNYFSVLEAGGDVSIFQEMFMQLLGDIPNPGEEAADLRIKDWRLITRRKI